jgi:hypothetical protein
LFVALWWKEQAQHAMDSPLHPALVDALQQRNFSDISRLMDQAELQVTLL